MLEDPLCRVAEPGGARGDGAIGVGAGEGWWGGGEGWWWEGKVQEGAQLVGPVLLGEHGAGSAAGDLPAVAGGEHGGVGVGGGDEREDLGLNGVEELGEVLAVSSGVRDGFLGGPVTCSTSSARWSGGGAEGLRGWCGMPLEDTMAAVRSNEMLVHKVKH